MPRGRIRRQSKYCSSRNTAAAGWRSPPTTRSGTSCEFPVRAGIRRRPAASESHDPEPGRGPGSPSRQPIGRDLPELRIEHLERDVTVVADPSQVVEIGPIWKSPSPGRIRSLSPASSRGVPLRSQSWTQARFSRTGRRGPRTCSGRCSSGRGRGRPRRWRPRICATRARAVPGRRISRRPLKLERDPDTRTSGELGRLTQARRRHGVVLEAGLRGTKSAATIRVGTPSSRKHRSRRRK